MKKSGMSESAGLPFRKGAVGLACMLALAACGGGSDGGGASNVAATPPAVVAQEPGAPALTNNIPADGLAWINYRRAQIGVATLVRSSVIDRAAQGHSDYQKANNVVSHDQTAGNAAFTGVDVKQRLLGAGYVFGSSGYAGEVISATSSASGFYMAEELITAIYHRFAIFEPKFKEIGTGAATDAKNYTYFTTDFTTANGVGGLGRGVLVTWPASNQMLVPANFLSDNETPDPVAGVNEVGYPISLHADIESTIRLNSFTVRARGAGADLAVKTLSPGGDAHTSLSVAAIIPLSPLKAGTVYDVTFSGTVDGVAAGRSWAFTTR